MGNVPVEIKIMTEKDSEKPRGFGFATFEEFEHADKLCAEKYIKIRVSLLYYIPCVILTMMIL